MTVLLTAMLATRHLDAIDVEEPDRTALGHLADRPVALDLRQPADAVTLQTAVRREQRQVWNRGLERVAAVVEREQRMPSLRRSGGRVWLSFALFSMCQAAWSPASPPLPDR